MWYDHMTQSLESEPLTVTVPEHYVGVIFICKSPLNKPYNCYTTPQKKNITIYRVFIYHS